MKEIKKLIKECFGLDLSEKHVRTILRNLDSNSPSPIFKITEDQMMLKTS